MSSFNTEKATFLTQMDTELPDLCSRWNIIDEHDYLDYYFLKFKTKKPVHIDRVVEKFEDDAHLSILYHRVASSALVGWQAACAFYNSGREKMWKFLARADANGIVTEIEVKLFNSLDLFIPTLRVELDLQRATGELKVEMDEAELVKMIFG